MRDRLPRLRGAVLPGALLLLLLAGCASAPSAGGAAPAASDRQVMVTYAKALPEIWNANTLALDCPPEAGSMYADLTKVRQSLFNLLSNACKFTEHGTISLTVRRQENGGSDGRASGHASMTFRCAQM